MPRMYVCLNLKELGNFLKEEAHAGELFAVHEVPEIAAIEFSKLIDSNKFTDADKLANLGAHCDSGLAIFKTLQLLGDYTIHVVGPGFCMSASDTLQQTYLKLFTE